ncbi:MULTISPECIES: hypothetical protein [unclassified Streptomyces]|uniref:hypothetical protein n=1 Tax=unclassified Streptomyces TaxID=2593676 RepID=UPI000DC46EB8|nr:hypothetical protein [Streptomyces sp. PsTaAH-137]RAJ88812.1 hypothetical protein K377_02272 [Streptomyces sp. PsTaAH-137]
MRKLATATVATALFIGGMGTAFAGAWHSIPKLDTSGAAFTRGTYTWEPRGQNHGAFHLRGDLSDTSKSDGNNVYAQAKVEGYSWNRFNGKQGKTVPLDKVVYDGAAQLTKDAWVRMCRDRGSTHPDNCSVTKHYQR